MHSGMDHICAGKTPVEWLNYLHLKIDALYRLLGSNK